MDKAPRSGRVAAEFFYSGFRISAVYDTQKRLLADIIYDGNVSYLTIEEVYLSSIGKPAEILGNYPSAMFMKSKLEFFLTLNQEDGLRRDQLYGNYKLIPLVPIFVTFPFYELTGFVRHTGKFDPISFMTLQSETFVTMLNVTVRSAIDPSVTFQGGAAVLNKAYIGAIGQKATK